MTKHQSTKLSTKMGTFTVIWSEEGITEIRTPGSNTPRPKAPAPADRLPKWLEDALEMISKHLEGKPQNLDKIPVDLTGHPDFHQKVYLRLKKLPVGQTVSYGQLADLVGAHGAARAVGHAMATNPIPFIIPCHRVVKSDGTLGEYSAMEGQVTKRKLLELEGCDFNKKSKKNK